MGLLTVNIFSQTKMSPQQILSIAEATKTPALEIAIRENGFANSVSFWEQVRDIETSAEKYPLISLGNDHDVVGRLASNVARSIQFPESSAYMHFLACVSAAMLGRFTVGYHGTQQPTALYVVTSQPPSTGKSAINAYSINPITAEVDRINEERKKERKRIMAKLSALKTELKGEKSKSELAELYEEQESLEEKLEAMSDITFPVSDTTPEGLARINNRQGNFAVISDEATSINSLLGLTYQDSTRKTNSELVLKAWDSGKVSIARANQDNNMSFVALGAIAVIAQDETIDSIMSAGARGIGVSERFLLVREESFLGRRKFVDDKGNSTFEPVDKSLVAEYYKLIHEIMTDSDVKLSVNDAAMRYLNRARQEMECELADGGKYAHSMLRGAMGKFDKQAIRIAAVLHTIRNWHTFKGSPQKGKSIDLDTMMEAVAMYYELSKTYLSAANAAGHAGEDAEIRVLSDFIVKRAPQSKGVMKYRSLYEGVRKIRPFNGQAGVADRIKKVLLPKLQELNHVCVIGEDVFINPAFMGR